MAGPWKPPEVMERMGNDSRIEELEGAVLLAACILVAVVYNVVSTFGVLGVLGLVFSGALFLITARVVYWYLTGKRLFW